MFNQNPVFQKEVRLSVRSIRLSMLVLGFNGILALVSLLVLYGMMNQMKYRGVLEYEVLLRIYSTMAYIEFAMFMLIIPGVTAANISGERERKTLDILLSSKMSAFDILLGKLEASLHMVGLLVISSLPVLSLVFIFGGISIWDLMVMLITLFVSGIFAGSIGLFFSTVCRKTTTSTLLTYLTLIFFVCGTYVLIYLVHYMNLNSAAAQEGVRRMIYLLLTNPAITYASLITNQVENNTLIRDTYRIYAPTLLNGRVLANWTLFSMIFQIGASAGLIGISTWILDPLHKKRGS